MTEFTPQIPVRETEELIEISNSTNGDWQLEAINQAKAELVKRGITIEQQQKVLDRWRAKAERIEKSYQRNLELNRTERYTTGKMIYIFLVAPFILVGRWTVDLSLIELRKENYQIKFKQRVILLIGGTLFWISFIVFNLYTKEN